MCFHPVSLSCLEVSWISNKRFETFCRPPGIVCVRVFVCPCCYTYRGEEWLAWCPGGLTTAKPFCERRTKTSSPRCFHKPTSAWQGSPLEAYTCSGCWGCCIFDIKDKSSSIHGRMYIMILSLTTSHTELTNVRLDKAFDNKDPPSALLVSPLMPGLWHSLQRCAKLKTCEGHSRLYQYLPVSKKRIEKVLL